VAGVFPASAHATNDPENGLLRQTVLGPFLFDRGPSSDRHERGASIPTWNFNSRRRGLSELDRFAGTDGRCDAQLQWPTEAVGMVSPTNLGCRPSEQTSRRSREKSVCLGASARCWTMGGCTKIGSAAMNEVIAGLTIAHFRV